MANISHKTRLEDEEKRNIPLPIKKLLEYDVKLTKNLVSFVLNFTSVRSLKTHCKFLEISCHGILWLCGWLAFCYLFNNKDLYQMQVNMIVGLLLDIIFVAIIKAATRRRRPSPVTDDIFSVGPDKFSFPSGHASRSFYILCFFTYLYPLPWFVWPPLFAWAFTVSFSRLLIYRHHLLDILAGVCLGVLEAFLLNLIWFNEDISKWIITMLSEDYVPDGPQEST